MSAVAYDTDLMSLLGVPPPSETKRPAAAANCNGPQSDDESRNPQAQYTDELSALLGPPPSPLDRPLAVARFADVRAARIDAQTTTLRKLADTIRTTRAPAKASLPLLKLGTFGDVPTLKGSLRHDANLQTVTGIEGDYDGGVVTPEVARFRLATAGVAAIVATTPSHTDDAPRWRVLAPLSQAVTPAERLALAERLNGALDGILAPETFTASQAFYFGAVGDAPAPLVLISDGDALDRRTEIPRIGKRAEPDPATPDDGDDDDLWAMLTGDLVKAAEAMPFVSPEPREDWLTIGMALHHEGRGSDEAYALWCEWSRGSDKFNERDQRRVWKSFGESRGRAVVTIASLYDLAKVGGWNAEPTPKPSPAAASTGLTFLTPDQCEAAPSRGYLIKGLLAPGDVGCIFGQPGAGKSLIGPHLGYALAQGREAFGMRSRQGSVFYVAAEDPHGMKGRVTALKIRHGSADSFALVEGVSDLLSDDSPHLAALLAAVEAQRPALVFIDTLAMAFPGLEENSAEGMGRVVAAARSLTAWGAAVVLVHHSTKAEGKTPRGHSLFNGALDMAMHVEKGTDGVVRGQLTKNRNGSCDRDIAFLIGTTVLGIDDDGDPVTSALVEELAAGSAPKQEKLSPSAQAAFDVLLNLLPVGVSPMGIHETVWRDACVAGRAVSGAEDAEARKRAFRRANRELADKGRTAVIGDMVRPADINDSLGLMDNFDDLAA